MAKKSDEARRQKLIKDAEDAIDAVFNDSSVSRDDTRTDMQGLVDYIRESVSTLRD